MGNLTLNGKERRACFRDEKVIGPEYSSWFKEKPWRESMGFNDVKVTAQQELFFMFMHFTWSEADRGGQSGARRGFRERRGN